MRYPENETSTAQWWAAKAAKEQKEMAEDLAYAQSKEGQIRRLERKLDALYADKDAHTKAEIAQVEMDLGNLKGPAPKGTVIVIQRPDGQIERVFKAAWYGDKIRRDMTEATRKAGRGKIVGWETV